MYATQNMTAEIKLLYLKILVKFFLYLSKSQAVIFLKSLLDKSGLEEEYISMYSVVQKSTRLYQCAYRNTVQYTVQYKNQQDCINVHIGIQFNIQCSTKINKTVSMCIQEYSSIHSVVQISTRLYQCAYRNTVQYTVQYKNQQDMINTTVSICLQVPVD